MPDGNPPPPPDGVRRLGPSALRAYAHPLRLRMIQFLTDRGPATATQLAAEFGESTGQTSYHLRQLAKHGLVEDDTTRGRGRERWWKSTSFHLSTTAMVREDPRLLGAAQLMLDAVVKARSDALRSWLAQLDHAPQQWVEVSTQDQTTIHLTPDETRRLNDEVAAVLDTWITHSEARLQDDSVPADAERVRVYYDVFPLAVHEEEPSEHDSAHQGPGA